MNDGKVFIKILDFLLKKVRTYLNYRYFHIYLFLSVLFVLYFSYMFQILYPTDNNSYTAGEVTHIVG